MLSALLTLPLSLLIAQPPAMPPGAANARVTGRVVEAETGAPVSGAFVLLVPVVQSFPAAAMGPPQALTDTNGEFAVERVWAGRYRIEIQKTGFAPLSDITDAPTLNIEAEQSVTGLAFAMKKGSVIAGRVVDAGGEPLSEITVAALRPAPGADGRPFGATRTSQMSQTNDRGEFRLAGLAEGHYVVIAAPRPRPLFATSQPVGGTVLAPTYYPGTPDREAAHVIDVGAAQTIDGIQFALVAVPAHQVTGIVVDQAGSPQAGVMLTLMASREAVGAMGPPTMVQTDQAGTFTIGGVVAGTYRVMAMIAIAVRDGAGASGGLRNGVGGVFGAAGGIDVAVPVGGIQTQGLPSAEVTVGATDVTGVQIVVPARHP